MSKRKQKSSRARSQRQRNVASVENQAPQNAATAPAGQESRQEYEYVSKDLKRVTVLAAAMFALLVGLSFFIG